MHKLILLALVLLCCGCASRPPSVTQGGFEVPPTADKTSNATENIIAQRAEALAAKDKARASALEKELVDQNKAEINGELRWLITIGIMILAVGAGLAFYLGPKLGGGVAIVGGAMIAGSLFVTSIVPYLGWIALGGGVIAVVAVLWHMHTVFTALNHTVHDTEHLASDGAKKLVAKLEAAGPSYAMRLKAMLHSQPITPPAATPTAPIENTPV